MGDNVQSKPKRSRKSSHNVSGIPLTMWGTNLNEDAYCADRIMKYLTVLAILMIMALTIIVIIVVVIADNVPGYNCKT